MKATSQGMRSYLSLETSNPVTKRNNARSLVRSSHTRGAWRLANAVKTAGTIVGPSLSNPASSPFCSADDPELMFCTPNHVSAPASRELNLQTQHDKQFEKGSDKIQFWGCITPTGRRVNRDGTSGKGAVYF